MFGIYSFTDDNLSIYLSISGRPDMDTTVLANQQKLTFISSGRTQDAV